MNSTWPARSARQVEQKPLALSGRAVQAPPQWVDSKWAGEGFMALTSLVQYRAIPQRSASLTGKPPQSHGSIGRVGRRRRLCARHLRQISARRIRGSTKRRRPPLRLDSGVSVRNLGLSWRLAPPSWGRSYRALGRSCRARTRASIALSAGLWWQDHAAAGLLAGTVHRGRTPPPSWGAHHLSPAATPEGASGTIACRQPLMGTSEFRAVERVLMTAPRGGP